MIASRIATGCSALLLVALALLGAGPATATAQDAPPEGRITGTITSGSADTTLGPVEVRLLILEGGSVIGDEQTTATDGTFEFAVPATARRDYVVTAQYQQVQYILPAVVLTADEPEAEVDLIVYEATETAPDLRILETVVTLIAIDRDRSELWLRREDTVLVPGDRVFIGDDTDVTLRLPTPEGVTDVSGGTLDGGVLSTTNVLFPGDDNVVVTAYIVRYDATDDEYGVRITAPVPTDHIELRVPEGYVHRVEPLEEAGWGEPITIPASGPGTEAVVLEVVVLDGPIEPGRGLLADFVGLSGTPTVHPLTTQPGAGIAAAFALVLITGAAVIAWQRRSNASADTP